MKSKSTEYSGTPLAKKLGLKPEMRIILLNEPGDYFDKIDQPASLFDLVETLQQGMLVDFIHVFSKTTEQLNRQLEFAVPLLDSKGMLWVSWPKGIKTFSRENVRETGLSSGLVDIKVAAFDEQWSGLKFVYRLIDRN